MQAFGPRKRDAGTTFSVRLLTAFETCRSVTSGHKKIWRYLAIYDEATPDCPKHNVLECNAASVQLVEADIALSNPATAGELRPGIAVSELLCTG